MTTMFRTLGRATLACALAVVATAPAVAAADGLPRLDPTNGGPGTHYIFIMPVTGRTMDPAAPSFLKVFRGTFTLFQDSGQADFDITDMNVDTDNDGLVDRTLECSGWVGNMRFGVRCSEDDGGAEIRLLITGRAVRLANGRVALRRATGQGFTETHTLLTGFLAGEQ